jgi:hypothetical protein
MKAENETESVSGTRTTKTVSVKANASSKIEQDGIDHNVLGLPLLLRSREADSRSPKRH